MFEKIFDILKYVLSSEGFLLIPVIAGLLRLIIALFLSIGMIEERKGMEKLWQDMMKDQRVSEEHLKREG